MNQPHVIIKLDKPSHVGHIRIVNRTGTKDLQARASGLTLSLSRNGTDWQKTWQSESVQPVWHVSADATAQFLKLSLPGKGTLHLNQVVVFGKPAPKKK